ncbi:MAG: pentapeptide repeat-containing protein [Methylocella sp.]
MSDEIARRPDESPSPAEKFAGKAHDLDAARRSVEDAASVSTGLWLSFLGVLVYLGVAAGAVTHKDLLLENPVKLPFLSDVPLPLIAFFVLAPIVFIVSHAYTLVHFVMLAAKTSVFETELKNQVGGATETKEYLRWQLPSNIFVQILAGPARIRKGALGLLLQVIAWNSLVFGPIFLLLLIQVQFLPFHREWVTWEQRCALLADLTLLWALWPSVIKRKSEIKWPHPWHYPGFTIASLCALGLAFTAATFPGEWMEQWIGRRQWIPPNPLTALLIQKDSKDPPAWSSFHDLLFNGRYDETSQRRTSPFSNTLVLPGFDALDAATVDDPKKPEAAKQSLVLRGRQLEGAVFRGANLRKAILENAHLEGALLYQAQLQGVSAYQADFRGAVLFQAKLQGASLDSAQLQGAWLERAELQGAWALNADLKGALLDGARLQGASLNGARLQGASLNGAELQGARLDGAYLWRAVLSLKSIDAIRAQGLTWEQVREPSGQSTDPEPWTNATFFALKKTIEADLPAGDARDEALKRIDVLDPGSPFADAARMPDWRKKIEDAAMVESEEYKKALIGELKALACSGDGDAAYVVRGLSAYGRIKDTGGRAAELVDAILKPDCPVSAALTDADKAALGRHAKEARGGASKQ